MKRLIRVAGGLAFFLGGLLAVTGAFSQDAERSQTAVGPIHIIQIDSSINPVVKDYIVNSINEGYAEGASMVLIELDTPGGLVSSTKEIVDAMLNAKLPVVVWVGPAGAWAASAGTFITMAAHVAVMAEGATIGAAHPVNIDGSNPGGTSPETPTAPQETPDNSAGAEDPSESEGSANPEEPATAQGDPIEEKMTNFTSEWAREIANKRGRNADWAEMAVRRSVTVGATEAVEKNIIDFTANSRFELLEMLNGRTVPVVGANGVEVEMTIYTENVMTEERPMSWHEMLLNYLADPNLVYILLSIGTLALVYEFLNPGIGIGFAFGGISLLLAFMGLQVLPVSLVGISLILFGVLLMVLDVFTPTNGILTVFGILSMLVGSLSLFEIPEVQAQLSIWNIIVIIGMVTAFFAVVVTKGLTIQRRQSVAGAEGMIGMIGRVEDVLNPQGRVFVNGEYWFASSADGLEISPQEQIVVEKIEQGKLFVRRKK